MTPFLSSTTLLLALTLQWRGSIAHEYRIASKVLLPTQQQQVDAWKQLPPTSSDGPAALLLLLRGGSDYYNRDYNNDPQDSYRKDDGDDKRYDDRYSSDSQRYYDDKQQGGSYYDDDRYQERDYDDRGGVARKSDKKVRFLGILQFVLS
jgi:hypothetical protein